jgi:hypothetical protein
MIINYHCKANKKVWAFQNFRVNDRYQCKDGNYILWQSDLVNIGSKLGLVIGSDFVKFLSDVCERIGAVLLTLAEAKAEEDGTETRTLPVALDPRFVLDDATKSADAASSPDGDSGEAEKVEETDKEEESV